MATLQVIARPKLLTAIRTFCTTLKGVRCGETSPGRLDILSLTDEFKLRIVCFIVSVGETQEKTETMIRLKPFNGQCYCPREAASIMLSPVKCHDCGGLLHPFDEWKCPACKK